ncbi:MAG: multiheme c-type cytochrome, partial [Deltaproteobacteria bacterium]|nr:multiheme c-type cytochrome [Deltaproteobacteria bacterium]
MLVDTGDLLYYRPPTGNPNEKKIGDLKAELYMKTYNLMGYDAFTPGELDFSFGVGEIIRMSKRAHFPFLAANLMVAQTHKPVFKPYLIKEFAGVKIGLLGLVSKEISLGGPPEESKKYYLADPIEVAKKFVAELKKEKCQVIAVLGHMELPEQEMLAKNVPGIQFILSGHVPHHQLNPIEANRSEIIIAGSRGEHLGQVDFFVEQKTLYSHYQLVSLTTKFTDHPQVQEWLNQYKIDLQKLLQTLPPISPRKSPAPTRRQVAIPATPLFMGENYCLPCHPQQHPSWMNTSHARAYQTLSRNNKSSDPTCLACHTTGLGIVRNPNAFFENVQCEACHGPTEGHPDLRKRLSPIGEDQCRKCHNTGNSPNFHYPTYLQKNPPSA